MTNSAQLRRSTPSIQALFDRAVATGGAMQKRSSGGEKLRTAVRQLQPNELFAGAKVVVSKRRFVILESAECTSRYMESKPDLFPLYSFPSCCKPWPLWWFMAHCSCSF